MGQRRLFAENAEQLGLCIADIDTAIVSHGHYDHGGGLRAFLEINDKAKVYIHKDAFQPHYSLKDYGLKYIGLDTDLQDNPRLVMCDSLTRFDDQMTIFADVIGDCCCPQGNSLLFGPSETQNDSFTHEQNLIIEENGKVILFAGCAHKGIINIIRRAEDVTGKSPTHVFAGLHLAKTPIEDAFISTLAHELTGYEKCKFYTMHCTGTEQYLQLKAIMGNQIEYLSCGEIAEI
jgi:7,8-dihydropterin-6-yl-methyl-4-(beta-D-ribofuranosyl)aminobenzene 5'-phosphate synthase